MNAILAQAAARARDILIGSGIPLFGQPGRDVRLEHTRTHTFDKGFVRTAYSLPASWVPASPRPVAGPAWGVRRAGHHGFRRG